MVSHYLSLYLAGPYFAPINIQTVERGRIMNKQKKCASKEILEIQHTVKFYFV